VLVGDRLVRTGHCDRTRHVEQRLVEPIVAAGDPHASGVDEFGVLLVAKHEIKQLDPAPGTRLPDFDGEGYEWNRSDEFHREASQVERITGRRVQRDSDPPARSEGRRASSSGPRGR
jgi:hypothetical protein